MEQFDCNITPNKALLMTYQMSNSHLSEKQYLGPIQFAPFELSASQCCKEHVEMLCEQSCASAAMHGFQLCVTRVNNDRMCPDVMSGLRTQIINASSRSDENSFVLFQASLFFPNFAIKSILAYFLKVKQV